MDILPEDAKRDMEECKERARDAGLSFDDETIELITTNREMNDLSPKFFIPTLYDHWLFDVLKHKAHKEYELNPSNPYECVINTRPVLSFYNANNTRWQNIVIFYHVLAHVDFFQNNVFFRNTWNYDFRAKAASHSRIVNKLRAKHGEDLVDYLLEFARCLSAQVDYYGDLNAANQPKKSESEKRLDYFLDDFIKEVSAKNGKSSRWYRLQYQEEVERLNSKGDFFWADVIQRYPEFEAKYEDFKKKKPKKHLDLLEYLVEFSPYLNERGEEWRKIPLHIARETELYFAPQKRTKTINESHASFWHDHLAMQDERVQEHLVAYSVFNATTTRFLQDRFNPYSYVNLFKHMKDKAEKGQYSKEFSRLTSMQEREDFDTHAGGGIEFLLNVRKYYDDIGFFNEFLDQEFVDKHDLSVLKKHISREKGEIFLNYNTASKKASDYKRAVLNILQDWRPPLIEIDGEKTSKTTLYLKHVNEGKLLKPDWIELPLVGLDYLWNGPDNLAGPVHLETFELTQECAKKITGAANDPSAEPVKLDFQRVQYTSDQLKLSRKTYE